jgi:class 3 adenylate cyclase
VTNVAARRCQLAGSGEVVVSGDIVALLEQRGRFEDIGVATLKNIHRPVSVHRLVR